MQQHLPRRDFLKISLATAGGPLGLQLAASTATAAPQPVPGADKLTVYQVEPGNPHVWIRWANRLLCSYRAHHSQKYPYLYPLAGPVSGLSLTSETSLPYPHHRSLLFGCDRVNGGNYWQAGLQAGQILSTGPTARLLTPQSAEIVDQCRWKKPDGPVVAQDQRKITVTVASSRLRLIDFEIKWTAVEPLAVGPTNHSLFAIRAAVDLTPWGGGALVNSEGKWGEKDTFGKPAAWCGFHGRWQSVPGKLVEGIALFDHPKNPWAPCPWFTRDYGFASPTPFYFRKQPWQLPAGESVALRYRVVLHAGDHQDAALDTIYAAWAAG